MQGVKAMRSWSLGWGVSLLAAASLGAADSSALLEAAQDG